MNRDDPTRPGFAGGQFPPSPETAHPASSDIWDRILELTDELGALPPEEAAQRLAALEAAGEPEKIIGRVRIYLGIQLVPKTSEELAPDTIVGREYRIVSKLGSGGMGVVYEAVLEKTGQTVALKMIQPGLILEEMRERFIQEMKALGRLDHPGIVGIRHAGHHIFEPDGAVSDFFTMDRIVGSRVHDYLQTAEATLTERLRIIRDVAIAVQYAHDRGVVHRDLKPGNMMIRTDARVMIFDFGLAAALAFNDAAAVPLGAEGTPPYMAPEQAEAAPASPAADIYSLGAILYEMLTGEPLFQVDPGASRMMKVQTARHPPPRPPLRLPDAPHTLPDILDKALAPAPEDRFPSAAAFARAINRLLPAHLVHEPPHGWRPAAGVAVPATDWVLEEKLGDGAHGQVWLARNRPAVSPEHEKAPLIPPPRVYKFCATEAAARTLRREHRVFQALKAAADATRSEKTPWRGRVRLPDGENTGPHGETPGILPVEAWSLDEPPYYIAVRWMEGACDLSAWAEGREVREDQALAIVCSVAEALQFAHDIGVLHRDVKPANILVRDDPAAPGGVRAWLVDFGLAAFDETLWQSFLARSISSQADFDKLAGTPDYIAPEVRRRHAATTRSDLYSLGVVLCRLLRGNLSGSLNEWRRHVSDPFIQEDLSRCLADDPDERFPSGAALAASLRSIPERRAASAAAARAEAEAAAAAEASAHARERRAYRKGTVRTTGIAAVIVTLLAGMAWYSHEKHREAQAHLNNIWLNESRLRLSEIQALRQSNFAGRGGQILNRLERAEGKYPPEDTAALRNEAIAALAMASPGSGGASTTGRLPAGAVIAAGARWAAAGAGKAVQVFEMDGKNILPGIAVPLPAPVARSAIAPDGSFAAAVTETGALWLVPSKGEPLHLQDSCGLSGLAVHASCRIAVPAAGGQVHLFTQTAGRWAVAYTLGVKPPVLDENASAETPPGPFLESAEQLAFSADGRYLAVSSAASLHVQVWECGSGKPAGVFRHTHIPTALAWDPVQTERLWTGAADGGVFAWNVAAMEGAVPVMFRKAEPGFAPIRWLDAAHDLPFLTATGEDGQRLFLLKQDLSLDTQSRETHAAASGFRSDDRLWTLDADGTFFLNPPASRMVTRRTAGDAPVLRMSQSHDGSLLAASCGNSAVVTDAAAFGPPVALPTSSEMMSVSFAAGRALHSTGVNGARSWTWQAVHPAQAVFTREQRLPGKITGGGEAISLKIEEKEWLVFSESSSIHAWPGDMKAIWEVSHPVPVTALACGRNTEWFAASGTDGTPTTLYFPSNQSIRVLPKPGEEVEGLACSPDGRLLVERMKSGLRVLDPETQRTLGAFAVPLPLPDVRTGRHRCAPVAVSADGLIAVSGGRSRILLFRMDTENPLPVAELAMPLGSAPTALLFTRSGALAAGTADGQLWLWRLPEMRRELQRLNLDWRPAAEKVDEIAPVRPVFSPDRDPAAAGPAQSPVPGAGLH